MYIYINVHTYIHTHMYMYIQILKCTYFSTYTYQYIYTYAYKYIHLLAHNEWCCHRKMDCRNTLQHTRPHCNTLQHTATHCNTLQHTATHCNTLDHTATQVQYTAVSMGKTVELVWLDILGSVLKCVAVFCRVLQCVECVNTCFKRYFN